MTKPLSLFHSAFWNILTICVTAVAGFVIVPLIIKSIGNENYGMYTIILMIGGFVGLQSLGLGEATLKYVAQYYSRKDLVGINRVLGATLTVYSFSAVVISGLIIIFAKEITYWFKISPQNINVATYAFQIAGFAFLLNTFKSVFKTIPEAVQRYDILNKYALVMLIVKYAVMYVILIKGTNIVGLTYLVLISEVADMFVYFFLARYLIKGVKCYPSFSRHGIKEVFSYGVFSFVNDLIQKAALYVDQFILGIFYSTSAVGHLAAPKDLISRAQGLTGAVGRGLFPRFSSMKEDENMQRLYSASLWSLTIFSLAIFVPLAIIIPSFLSKWISPDFAVKSSDFAVLFSLGVALNGGVGAYQALLKGTGRVKWLTNIISILTVTSGIVTAILVYKFGIIGAGVRVILFSWVGIAICFYVGHKVFHSYDLWRDIIQSAIIPVVVSAIFFFGVNKIIDSGSAITWIGIVSFYAGYFSILLTLLVLSNILVYRKHGEAYYLILRLKQLKKTSDEFNRFK